jgi:hypothetical protein
MQQDVANEKLYYDPAYSSRHKQFHKIPWPEAILIRLRISRLLPALL